jgi:hypothetical protein
MPDPGRRPIRAPRGGGGAIVLCLLALAGGGALAQVTDTGGREVVAAPLLTVTVPMVAELRLAAAEVDFDLGGGLQSRTLVCVYGFQGGDPAAATFEGATVFPLGTGFRQGEHPAVVVEGAGAVTGFPPLRLDAGGQAVARSEEDFVCYRTFLLRRFSNLPGWQLTVERPASDGSSGGPASLYIRDSGCRESGSLQGLHPLDPGERRVLASAGASDPCFEGDVVVLAAKIAAVRAGETPAHLVYTLMAPLFDAEP